MHTPLYLVDASLYVFRAWHSMPDEFQDQQGWPTNAVHGFARFLLDLLERERPQHIAIAFDEALDSCFRHSLYAAYKAKYKEQSYGEAEIFKQQYLKDVQGVLNSVYTRRIPNPYSQI